MTHPAGLIDQTNQALLIGPSKVGKFSSTLH